MHVTQNLQLLAHFIVFTVSRRDCNRTPPLVGEIEPTCTTLVLASNYMPILMVYVLLHKPCKFTMKPLVLDIGIGFYKLSKRAPSVMVAKNDSLAVGDLCDLAHQLHVLVPKVAHKDS